jgi:hypothetical protein
LAYGTVRKYSRILVLERSRDGERREKQNSKINSGQKTERLATISSIMVKDVSAPARANGEDGDGKTELLDSGEPHTKGQDESRIVHSSVSWNDLPDTVWIEVGCYFGIEELRVLRQVGTVDRNHRWWRLFTSPTFYQARSRTRRHRRNDMHMHSHSNQNYISNKNVSDTKNDLIHGDDNDTKDELLCFVGGHYSMVMTKKKKSSKKGGGGVSGRLGGRHTCYEYNGYGRIYAHVPESLHRQSLSTSASSSLWRLFGTSVNMCHSNSGSLQSSSNHKATHKNVKKVKKNPICRGTLTESCTVFLPHLGEVVFLGGILEEDDDDDDDADYDYNTEDDGSTTKVVWSYSFYTNQWRQWPSMLRGRTKAMCRAVFVPSSSDKGNANLHGDGQGGRLIVMGSDPDPVGNTVPQRYTDYLKRNKGGGSARRSTTHNYSNHNNNKNNNNTARSGCHCEVFDFDTQKWTPLSEEEAPYHPGDLSNAVVLTNRYIVMCCVNNSDNGDGDEEEGSEEEEELSRRFRGDVTGTAGAGATDKSSKNANDEQGQGGGIMYDIVAQCWTILPVPLYFASRSSQSSWKRNMLGEIATLDLDDDKNSSSKIVAMDKDLITLYLFDPALLEWSMMETSFSPCRATSDDGDSLFCYDGKLTICISESEQRRGARYNLMGGHTTAGSTGTYNKNVGSTFWQLHVSKSSLPLSSPRQATGTPSSQFNVNEERDGSSSLNSSFPLTPTNNPLPLSSSTSTPSSVLVFVWKRILANVDMPLSQLKGAHFFSLTL